MPFPALADVVVVELPQDAAREGVIDGHALAAIDSCELNLGAERCRTPDEPGPQAGWHAIVTWRDAQQRHAHLELHRSGRDGPIWHERDLTFSDADALEQRYRALGLLIAFYVVAGNASREQHEPPAQDGPVPPAAPPLRASKVRNWGLDLAGFGGPALQVNQARAGALLRGWVAPFRIPLSPLMSLGWAQASGLADSMWLDASVGATLRIQPFSTALALEWRVEGLGQRLQLSATAKDRDEQRWLTRFGVRTGLEVVIDVSSGFALLAGAQASIAAPDYVVQVGDRPAGSESVPTWDLLGGLRFSR